MAAKRVRTYGGAGVGASALLAAAGRSAGAAGRPAVFKPFSPFAPEAPPPGTYDPGLDQQQASANRGYGDLQDDTAIQAGRDTEDYNSGAAGLLTALQRTQAGLGTEQQTDQQDYGTGVANMLRSFGNLATSQHESENAGGVLQGGTALQAAAKRSGNQGLAQTALDTTLARQNASIATREQTAQQDYGTQLGTLNQNYGLPTDQSGSPDALATGGRAFQDLGTALSRAGRENTQFATDTAATKAYQATQQGWDPSTGKPSNEFVNPVTGAAHKVYVQGGYKYSVGPDGTIISKTRRS